MQPFKNKVLCLTSEGGPTWPPSLSLDKSYKLLHRSDLGEAGMKKLSSVADKLVLELRTRNMDEQLIANIPGDFQFCDVTIYGVQWLPAEFVEQCLNTTHPCDSVHILPEVLQNTVASACRMSDTELARRRLLFLRQWEKRASALKDQEDELKSGMDASMACALNSKKILRFEEMVCSLGFPDKGVVEELKCGASLVGKAPCANMLPLKFAPALLSEDMLSMQAPLVRHRFSGHSRGFGDLELDESVWQQTLAEVDSHWLEGPMDLEQFPSSSPISRRFGVRQGPTKVRCVDDFSASNVSDAVETSESPALHTVDLCAALAKTLMFELREAGKSSSLVARTFRLVKCLSPSGAPTGTEEVWIFGCA